MFGYIVPDGNALSKERQDRFRAFYCGLCQALRNRYGLTGSATLSYDMTFLAMLLNALYEPGEHGGKERCVPHPIKAHAFVASPVMEYVAAVNIALAYHKCHDNWIDDKSLISAAEQGLLKGAYQRVKLEYPGKCAAIEGWLDEVHALEAQTAPGVDALVNATGRMLGELFVYDANDVWADELKAIGDGLGRFIYFMDAYEDLPEDIRKKRFNPLKGFAGNQDYEDMCREAMTMMVADATQAFEALPILLDADILRNVLYSGVWIKYMRIQEKLDTTKKGEP